jgi:uncharacterized protein (TIGR03435 family)
MSEKIFACLLRLFPSGFRERYEEESLRLLRDRLHDEKGFLLRLRLGIDLVTDMIGALPRAYRNSYADTSAAPSYLGIELTPPFQCLQKEPIRRGTFAVAGVLALTALITFTYFVESPFIVDANERSGSKSPIELVLERLNHSTSSDWKAGKLDGAVIGLEPEPREAPGKSGRSALPVSIGPILQDGTEQRSGESGRTSFLARPLLRAGRRGLLFGGSGKSRTFEVVSIREVKEVLGGRPGAVQIEATSNGYRMRGVPLMAVIQIAYMPSGGGSRFGPNQIEGIPESFNSIRFDIEARVSDADLPGWNDRSSQPAMLREMLQAMLAERFNIAVHHETKVVPVLAMIVGKHGPKFQHSAGATLDEIRRRDPNAHVSASGGVVSTGPDPGEQHLYGVTMPFLGEFLSNLAGRPVQDRTGLAGTYDVTYQLELPNRSQEGAHANPDFFSSQISYVAQEQLGLKLRPTKGTVESLVIDHVEKPSEN